MPIHYPKEDCMRGPMNLVYALAWYAMLWTLGYCPEGTP